MRLGFARAPLVAMEIGRSESGELEVRVPPRLPSAPLTVPMQTELEEAGFVSSDPSDPLEPWVLKADGIEAAMVEALTVLQDVFGVEVDAAMNVIHGSHRAEYEAARRLEVLRARVRSQLTEILGQRPGTDSEGDFVCSFDHIQVIVGPRVLPGMIGVVRVFAITNTDVTVGSELGLLLARLNFGLLFGRFALDVEHRAIWFDETLLGDEVTVDQLRFTVNVVAETAGEWDRRLQQMFGGRTHHDLAETERRAVTKPGFSPYL